MVTMIDQWRDAPIWDKDSIDQVTKDWFKYLGPHNNFEVLPS